MMRHRQPGAFPDALVYSSGSILVVPDTQLDAKCEGINLEDPWAEHTCALKFGSWTYDGDHIALKAHKDHMDLTDYRGFNQIQVIKSL